MVGLSCSNRRFRSGVPRCSQAADSDQLLAFAHSPKPLRNLVVMARTAGSSAVYKGGFTSLRFPLGAHTLTQTALMKPNMNGYLDMRSTFRPRSSLHVPGTAEEMRTGDAALRAAFAKQPRETAAPGETPFGNVASVILIERGVAYRSHAVAGERRVILDLLLPATSPDLSTLLSERRTLSLLPLRLLPSEP